MHEYTRKNRPKSKYMQVYTRAYKHEKMKIKNVNTTLTMYTTQTYVQH